MMNKMLIHRPDPVVLHPDIELRTTPEFSVYCLRSEPSFQEVIFDYIKKSKERRGWIDFENKNIEIDSKKIGFLCPACGVEGGSQRSATTNIPHFKGVTILSFVCEQCGFKTNEVKADSSNISATGMKWILKVDSESAMHRDLIKSKTAKISIPSLGFEMLPGSLGGLVTTVEGLLKQIHDRLKSSNPLARGDVADCIQQSNFSIFLDRLHNYRYISTDMEPFTIVMEDPMNESFIFSTASDTVKDHQLQQIPYTRSEQEEEECGLVAGDIGLDPEYAENLRRIGDPLPKPEDWEYTNDDDLTHNRFANFEEALLESLGVAGASEFMDTYQPWNERVQDGDFGVDNNNGKTANDY
jgi:ZPR1 zinc finger protein